MNATVAKSLLLSALILFGIIVVMILTGCIAATCGANEQFFCNVYCHIGKGLLLAGFVFIAFRVVRDLLEKS